MQAGPEPDSKPKAVISTRSLPFHLDFHPPPSARVQALAEPPARWGAPGRSTSVPGNLSDTH